MHQAPEAMTYHQEPSYQRRLVVLLPQSLRTAAVVLDLILMDSVSVGSALQPLTQMKSKRCTA